LLLMQPVVVVYVDNAEVVAQKWRTILPHVVVKQDPWHLQQRILRAVGDPKHLAYESFRGAISRAVFDLVEEGTATAKCILDDPTKPVAEKMLAWMSCRKRIPEGNIVYERLQQVLKDYKNLAGEDFITPETEHALQNQEGLVRAGYLSDPFPVEHMYYKDSNNRLRSHRSESQAENVIGR
jgi:hypothetical protein